MKKSLSLSILLFVLVFFLKTQAQDVLAVDPGYGTLNDAITQYQGDKIYQLQAGQWYGLNAIIENDGFALQIIGESPGDGMPAILQTGSANDGSVFGNMFSVIGDLTIKNVFIANQDLLGQTGTQVFSQSTSSTLTVDSCTIDPVGTGYLYTTSGDAPSAFFTNCLVLRHGHMTNPNDGHVFVNNNANGWVSFVLENNTFVSTGTGFISGDWTNQHQFVWINHNTIIHHKSQLDWAFCEKEYYLTNNIFFDFNTQLWNYSWTASFPDGMTPTQMIHGLVLSDTLSNETLPSSRVCFVEWNLQYTSQGFKDIVQYGIDNDSARAYLMPLAYTSEHADSNREAAMFADDVNWPYYKFGNYIEDVDPGWEDDSIYAKSEGFATWTLPMSIQHCWSGPAADADALPKWHWDVDADVDPSEYPSAWPRFNGVYTNSELLTASSAGLPLGDLNWFPEAKATYEANREQIEGHILSLSEDPLVLTGVDNVYDNTVPADFELAQNYPNPFNPSTTIKFSIPQSSEVTLKVYNVLGQEVAQLVNEQLNTGSYSVDFNAANLSSGLYFYNITAGEFNVTKKMMLVK
ncbi:MAG: T9SS type A sorting domain-containing protein [Ignavibacteria bacterium]|jgi:hypothetical protein